MNVCDLCSAPLGIHSTRFSASRFQSAVQSGLRPPVASLELGAAFGMTPSEVEEAWKLQVMSERSDWLLCPDCTAELSRILPPRKWYEFWK